MSKKQIRMAVIGGGRMARALGRILGRSSADVRIFVRNPKKREALAQELEGVTFDDSIGEAVHGSHTVFFAVPANDLADAADAYGPHARGDHIVMTACRGVGAGFTLPHVLIRSKTCVRKIGILGGPIHARELAAGRQINAVMASLYSEVIEAARGLTHGAPVTIHGTKDIVGVQVSGAVANVAAIAAGSAEALDMSENAKGVLLAHGLVDAKTLGIKLGADERTFFGLAGIGELIPRHVTSMDRHIEFGRLLGQGRPAEAAIEEVEGTVEGAHTAQAAIDVADQHRISLPLIEAVNGVLTGRSAAKEALEAVLHRSLELP
ncbi:MAG: NAD(P)-binding domain-containing protein [Myxococcota bacterium]